MRGRKLTDTLASSPNSRCTTVMERDRERESVVHPPPRERRQPHKDRQLELIPRGECVTVWQSGELKGRRMPRMGKARAFVKS
ncbi:hypothetical protein NQZ68_006190 [Dissostichus eleginoides]|nr:hypothetical protein NQZ68_006190 [Dissostichus eleginoides]